MHISDIISVNHSRFANCVKCVLVLVLLFTVIGSIESSAKSYSFSIDRERNVTIAQSSAAGIKIVKVVSYAKNAKKALDLALQDAVYSAIFTGIEGSNEFESIPPILLNGLSDYHNNKKFFDKFFKKGGFLSYASLVNTEFPSGLNNISTPRGRKVTVYVAVKYSELLLFLSDRGFNTFRNILK